MRLLRPPRLRARPRRSPSRSAAAHPRAAPPRLDATRRPARGRLLAARGPTRVTRRPVRLGRSRRRRCCSCSRCPRSALDTSDGALRQFPRGHETRVGFEAPAKVTGPGRRVGAEGRRPAADAAPARPRALRLAAPTREIARVAARATSRATAAPRCCVATPRHDGESARPRRRRPPARAELAGASRRWSAAAPPALQRLRRPGLRLDVEDRPVRPRAVVHRAAGAAALGRAAAEGGADEPAVASAPRTACSSWSSSGAGSTASSATSRARLRSTTITPPLVLAVVFGLSMDYEVFLLSRIRERFDGDRRHAPRRRRGPRDAAPRTITSAALIMVAVFAVFVAHRRAVDPAARPRQRGGDRASTRRSCASSSCPRRWSCSGRWNWWLPRPLARVLPARGLEEAVA